MSKKKELINVMIQYFYGNRVITEMFEDDVDRFILGYASSYAADRFMQFDKVDRSIIKIPNTNLVIIYNKFQEEEESTNKNVSASIPELGIILHSRCILCRMDDAGNLDSIRESDIETAYKYLSE